jgi:CheY-like chemotaxis protein
MDLRMPGMNGFETTRAIRAREADEGLPRTTILALTASVFEHDREAVMEAGCDGMLAKPYRERELFEMLSRHRGLSFQEEGPEGTEAPENPWNEDLQTLSVEWREAFRQALALGDTAKARQLVDTLPPSAAATAARLRQSLEAFRLDDLIRLFQT